MVESRGEVTALARVFGEAQDVVLLVQPSGELVFANRPFSVPEALDAARRDVAENGRAQIVDVAAGAQTLRFSVSPVLESGRVVEIIMLGADVTARAKTEARLRRSVALLVDTQGVAHLGTWEWDLSEPSAIWSDELYRIYGETPDSYKPSYEGYLQKVHPDDRGYVMEATKRVFEAGEPYSHDERIFRPDGTMRYLHTWAHAIKDEQGKVVKLVGVCQDITDRKLAEIALVEREAALRQAHKLEAIGRLAGGIAHDFNNLLGVIIGQCSLLMRKLPEGDPARAQVDEITAVGLQAARLTHQLLTFSREQVIQKEVLDLRRVVADFGRMLRRVIGEDIDLEMRLGEGRVDVLADRGHLEQVLLNLAVNARDAMPSGGRLAVEVATVPPGSVPSELDPKASYVMLAVSDTGVGMTEETLARIFEPFFSTKGEGRGTGLGLATVYGIVKQSGGAIVVKSAPGKGSRFAVYLPLAEAHAGATAGDDAAQESYRGSGTVLVVEDQAPLRHVMRNLLEGFGFEVLDVADPIEALSVVSDRNAPLKLLLTDVVMPRMSGHELAKRLTTRQPELKVLFVSGYAADDLIRRDATDGALALLHKPFTSAQLARALRGVLG